MSRKLSQRVLFYVQFHKFEMSFTSLCFRSRYMKYLEVGGVCENFFPLALHTIYSLSFYRRTCED